MAKFSQELLKNWETKEISQSELRLLIIIFIIEDFLFRLEDTTIPNLKEPLKGFLDFLKEIGSFKNNI